MHSLFGLKNFPLHPSISGVSGILTSQVGCERLGRLLDLKLMMTVIGSMLTSKCSWAFVSVITEAKFLGRKQTSSRSLVTQMTSRFYMIEKRLEETKSKTSQKEVTLKKMRKVAKNCRSENLKVGAVLGFILMKKYVEL